jgi:hypothetical protein
LLLHSSIIIINLLLLGSRDDFIAPRKMVPASAQWPPTETGYVAQNASSAMAITNHL